MKITYAITVCNEHDELRRLLNALMYGYRPGDQFVIQYDSSAVTDAVLSAIEEFSGIFLKLNVPFVSQGTPLNSDFATFKNQLSIAATGNWIFQIDADEYPTSELLGQLHDAVAYVENQGIDVVLVPRINIVHNITDHHLSEWGWVISKIESKYTKQTYNKEFISDGYYRLLREYNFIYSESINGDVVYYAPVVNFPDYQWRLYKNTPDIKWENKVHERLVGEFKYSMLPATDSYSLIHSKEITRQERQNKHYDQIMNND